MNPHDVLSVRAPLVARFSLVFITSEAAAVLLIVYAKVSTEEQQKEVF